MIKETGKIPLSQLNPYYVAFNVCLDRDEDDDHPNLPFVLACSVLNVSGAKILEGDLELRSDSVDELREIIATKIVPRYFGYARWLDDLVEGLTEHGYRLEWPEGEE